MGPVKILEGQKKFLLNLLIDAYVTKQTVVTVFKYTD